MTAGKGHVDDDVQIACEDTWGKTWVNPAKCPATAGWSHVCRSCRHVTFLCTPCHVARAVISLWDPPACPDCGSTENPEMAELIPKEPS